MSEAGNSAGRSWLSNGSYPASEGSEPETAESDLPDQRPDVPTPAERVAGLMADYPDLMNTPLSETHGRTLRESVMDERETIEREVDVGKSETITISETVAHPSGTWLTAVWDLLETYEKYRDMNLRMVREKRGVDREEFSVPLSISFSPEYQTATYAKLMALQRQLIGESADDSPTGEEFVGEFEEPVTALFGLTASSYKEAGDSGSGHRPPADHDRGVRDAWTGSTSSVKRTTRYVLEDKLGLDSSEYVWWWQSEPHPGDGPAAAYSHSHPIVIFDAAAASVPVGEIDEETFRPVVAKHVAECDGAEWWAHEISEEEESAVRVRKPDEIQDFGSYVSKYLSLGPEKDLLERSDKYIMWAASQWATATQKYSKSKTATAAIKADACHQRYADPEAEQSLDHGERLVRSEKSGVEWECACCGSHFGIDQSPDSLTEMRLSSAETVGESAVATDGGEEEEGPPQRLEDRWPSADSAARVGSVVRPRECDHPPGSDECPLCASETEAPDHTVSGEVPIPDHAEAPDAPEIRESFEREPQWRPDAIVRQWSGDETAIGAPGGTVFTQVVVEGVGSIRDRCGLDRLPPARRFDGPEPWNNDIPFSESDVREGRCPPPELVERERKELGVGTSNGLGAVRSVRVECPECGHQMNVHPAADTVACPVCDDDDGVDDGGEVFSVSGNTAHGAVTAKQWESDWYERRYSDDDADSRASVLSGDQLGAIRELVRVEPDLSPVEVCGQLMIDPSMLDAVQSVVDECPNPV